MNIRKLCMILVLIFGCTAIPIILGGCDQDTCEAEEEEVPDGLGSGLGDNPHAEIECAPTTQSTDIDPAVFEDALEDQKQNGFQGVVYLLSGDDEVFAEGVGGIDGPGSATPTLDTAFDCGSVTKEVTALVIYLLEEEGALQRSQTIGTFLDVPAQWSQVTIQHALMHQGGFEAVHDDSDFEPLTRAEALTRIFAETPRFAPGSDTYYSNSGYTVLGALIEVVTGRPYTDVVREKVWGPLEMTSTGFYGEETDAKSVAIGQEHLVHQGRNDPSAWPAPTWAILGNAGMVSTPRDLAKLSKGLHDGALFNDATYATFQRDFLETNFGTSGDPLEYAYSGSTEYGFNAAMRYIPEDDLLLIVNAHTSEQYRADDCAEAILEAIYGDP